MQSAAAAAGARRLSAASDRVNLGFIGLGLRGTFLRRLFQSMPDVNVVAGADLYDGHLETSREDTGGKMKLGKEYRAVLDNRDVEAVVIATPDHWHARMILDALAAGKDVYCEKPMTWSPAEAQPIIQAADRSDRILQIGSEARSTAMAQRAKHIVKSGVLGKINLVQHTAGMNTEDGAWRYAIPPDASPETCKWEAFLGSAPKIPWSAERFFRWRCWWDYSGGLATDLFVHLLTTLHEVTGAHLPRSVISSGGVFTWKDGRTVPDLQTAVYDYPQEFQFLCMIDQGSAQGEPNTQLTFMGSEGTLVMGGKEAPLVLYHDRKPPVADRALSCWPRKMREEFLEKHGIAPDKWPVAIPKRQSEQVVFESDSNHPRNIGNYPHARAFVDSAKQRTPSVEDARTGHRAALAAHMANRAYRERRYIAFDENTL